MRTFQALLDQIKFDSEKDELWLTGDLVNRGPDSLGVLRWAHERRDCVRTVLGNHDLHLLAAHAGAISLGPESPLLKILEAPDCDELCDWLRQSPLMIKGDGWALLHAGRLPEWSLDQALDLAAEAQERIQTDNGFLAAMYGDEPRRWDSALFGDDRHRLIVNAFTRMRLLSEDGGIVSGHPGPPNNRPAGTVPWFDFPGQKPWEEVTVCGHWSSAGLIDRSDLLAIDTGCLWGRCLTAVRLSDRKIFYEKAHPGDVKRS